MNKKEIENGIKEYLMEYDIKPYSSECKELHEIYIKPLLEKVKTAYSLEHINAAYTAAFFQGDKILARVGLVEEGNFREEEKVFELKDVI